MSTEIIQPHFKWTQKTPAVEVLKGRGGSNFDSGGFYSNLPGPLSVFCADKGFSPDAIRVLSQSGVLGELFTRLIFRLHPTDYSFDKAKTAVDTAFQHIDTASPSYSGSPLQNRKIQGAYGDLTHYNPGGGAIYRDTPLSGIGATGIFDTRGIMVPEEVSIMLAKTPVLVLGGGAAGVFTAAGLESVGFKNITVFEKKSVGGIWNQSNVRTGTINTPVWLRFNGSHIPEAPSKHPHDTRGRLYDRSTPITGAQNHAFIRKTASAYNLQVTEGTVKKIEPSDLRHVITLETKDGSELKLEAPIVINAMGATVPLPPSHEGHMTTTTPNAAGRRWQKQFTPDELRQAKEKLHVQIGLGNSTMEDLWQFHRNGIDYAVLTHMPKEAVAYPTEPTDLTVDSKLKYGDPGYTQYQLDPAKYGSVYRNLRRATDLTNVAGDLEWVENTYNHARNTGRIYPEIKSWRREGAFIIATEHNGTEHRFPAGSVATNIGYGNNPNHMRDNGLSVTDEYRGSVGVDYDAELQRNPGAEGRERVYPGYMGVGSFIKSDLNPNAQVLAGIFSTLYDTIFTAIVRAIEYNLKNS